ncbi:CYFA0S05e04478g1_1 [Cyberlindnera fabianii]|uniref:CYFA0S05e04478g1_1 n=1 Tax=Cyberlindnera fabianii TaxID=36022 RepID=A0A061B191_CYBFA|nr:CYFA0S05e04478g1_1 [Cyberlindnera fabianii]
MKYTLPFLLSLALAQPLHGHHDHQKREAEMVTVVVTQVVTVPAGGASSSSALVEAGSTFIPSTLETIVSSSVSLADQSSYYGASSAETTTLESSTAASSSKSTGSTASSSTSQSSYSSTSTGGVSYASGKGITYSPYTNSGTCKDADTIASDIAKLSQFELIRLYDTDCDGVATVFQAKTSSQKLFLGIYYLDKIEDSVSIISDAVSTYGSWDDVHTVSVGNELVNAGTNTPSEIKSAVDSARSYLKSAGYSGYVVSVDTLVAVQNNPELCDCSDYIAVNSHPFWDGNVTPGKSGDFLKTQISNIGSVCGGKDVLITETGWPTQGDSYGSAVPSLENQKLALESIGSEVADQVILFTMYDDLWKDAGSYGVEKYWGIFSD